MIDITEEVPINIKYEIKSWFPVIEYRDQVYREFGILVEVRSREQPHKGAPHVHAEYQGYEVSVNILTTEVVGNLPSKQLERVKEFINKNREFLLEKWEKYHGYKFSF